MTKQQQVKKDTPKAVELNKAALDQAAGGAHVKVFDGATGAELRPIADGTSNTLKTG